MNKIWENRQISNTYMVSEQIKAHIETMFINLGANSLNDLPSSMVPTETLYELVLGYSTMFDQLMESDLLKLGNKKHSNNLH
jgi:hypothetical protein